MPEVRSVEVSDVAGIWENFQQNLYQAAAAFTQDLGHLLWNLAVSAVILLLAWLLLAVVSRITGHVIKKQQEKRILQDDHQLKRVNTLMTLLRSTARYVIYLVAALMILDQFNLGKAAQNLLVTAGIGGLAIGFGAQSLVKDVVTGLFLMFENQFSVGDYIKIGDVEGTVTATALRTTYIQNEKGQQIILPNGSINRVVNYSRLGFSAADVTVMVSFAADTRKVMEIIQETVESYCLIHPEDLLAGEQPEVRGIVDMTNAAVKYSIYCKTQPLRHWETERGMRLAIKEALDAAGIK